MFSDDYDLSKVSRITVKRFNFDLYTTPRYKSHYVASANEELTSLLIRQNAKGVNAFIDVGAHQGFFSVMVGLQNPNCEIISFEPVSENCAIVEKNIQLHGIRAAIYQKAVSNVCGSSEFQISAASDNSGFIANPNADMIKKIDVETCTLDDYINQIPEGPLLIKIDAGGNEASVLDGMQEILRKYQDVRLVIEFNPECLNLYGVSPQSLLGKIRNFGFDIYFIYDDEITYRKYKDETSWEEYTGNRSYRNIFCVKSKKALNLCVFTHSAELAGAERSLLTLMDNLTEKYGCIGTVILPADGPGRLKFNELGIATIISDFLSWWAASTSLLQSRIEIILKNGLENTIMLFPRIMEMNPDLILTNTMVIPWGAFTALNLNIPHIWYIHEFGELDHRLQFFFQFQKTVNLIKESSNYIVVNSQAVYDAFYNDLGPEKCALAYYNFAFSAVNDDGNTYFKYPESLKLLIMGSLILSKGQDDAVHAVLRLIESGYDVELCVLGGLNTPFATQLLEFVQSKQMDHRIHFLGFLENVHPVIEQSDVNLVCSKHEAFGRVTAEAMLHSKPVIGTDAGGTKELIIDGETGFLYPPGNIDVLVEKIIFFIENRNEIKGFGEKARKNILHLLASKPADEILYKKAIELKGEFPPKSVHLQEIQNTYLVKIVCKSNMIMS